MASARPSLKDAGRNGAGRLGLGLVAVAALAAGVWHLVSTLFPSLHGAPLTSDAVDPALKLFGISLIAWVLLRSGDVLRLKFGDKEFEVRREVAAVTESANDTATTLKSEIDTLKKRVGDLEAWRTSSADLRVSETKVQAAVETTDELAPATETPTNVEPPKMPPLKPATVREDINKGRFGGLAAHDGYALAVKFYNTSADDPVVSLELFVTRTDGPSLTGNVHFFLHDSFARRELVFSAIDGVASTGRLLVWGGFTVGAWVEETEILLELDLALEPNAPLVIRAK